MFVMLTDNNLAIQVIANFHGDLAGPRVCLHSVDAANQIGSISISFEDADYARRFADAINAVKPKTAQEAA